MNKGESIVCRYIGYQERFLEQNRKICDYFKSKPAVMNPDIEVGEYRRYRVIMGKCKTFEIYINIGNLIILVDYDAKFVTLDTDDVKK